MIRFPDTFPWTGCFTGQLVTKCLFGLPFPVKSRSGSHNLAEKKILKESYHKMPINPFIFKVTLNIKLNVFINSFKSVLWFQKCDDLILLHLGYLDYNNYIITIRFYGLENTKFNFKDIIFSVSMVFFSYLFLALMSQRFMW